MPSYTTPLNLLEFATNEKPWGPGLNSNFTAIKVLSPIATLTIDYAEVPSTTLRVRVSAGVFLTSADAFVSYAGTLLTLPDNTSRYLWLTEAAVLVTGTSYPAANVIRLGMVTTLGGIVTAIVDGRITLIAAGGTAPYILKAGDTMPNSATFTFGTSTTLSFGAGSVIDLTAGSLHLSNGTLVCGNTEIATAPSQSLSFWGAAPIIQSAFGTEIVAGFKALGIFVGGSTYSLHLGTGDIACGAIVGGATTLTTLTATQTTLDTLTCTGFAATVVAISATGSVAATTFEESCDTTSASITRTLPTAAVAGRIVAIKKVDSTAHTVSIVEQGGGLIDGSATYTLSTQYQSAILQKHPTGANWDVIATVAGTVTAALPTPLFYTSTTGTPTPITLTANHLGISYLTSQGSGGNPGWYVGLPASPANGLTMCVKRLASSGDQIALRTTGGGLIENFSYCKLDTIFDSVTLQAAAGSWFIIAKTGGANLTNTVTSPPF